MSERVALTLTDSTGRSASPPSRSWSSTIVCGLLAWLAYGVVIGTTLLGSASAQDGGRGAISISGREFLRDGAPFIARGVQVTGFVGSQSVLAQKPWYLGANRSFGRSELEVAQSTWHANTILFKLGQPELDPRDPLYTQQYIDDMVQAVRLAQSMSFTIIVSVDELPPSGTASQSPLPTSSTSRAVETLAKLFGNDPDIMIELYNEPFSPTCARGALSNACSGVTPDAWALWRDGGGNYVGINSLIRTARTAGAKNVLLVQPLQHGGSFVGMPTISDPLHQTAFAVHPYFLFSGKTSAAWERNFGQFATNHPLIADEWALNSKAKVCEDPPEKAASEFLSFLSARAIGLVIWSIDLPGTMVSDSRGSPNTLEGFRCGEPGGGAGSLVAAYYASQANQGR